MSGEKRNQSSPPALLPWPFAEFSIAAAWMVGPLVLMYQWPSEMTFFILLVVPFVSGFTQRSWTVAGIGCVMTFFVGYYLMLAMIIAG
jgi:hypothetical protein